MMRQTQHSSHAQWGLTHSVLALGLITTSLYTSPAYATTSTSQIVLQQALRNVSSRKPSLAGQFQSIASGMNSSLASGSVVAGTQLAALPSAAAGVGSVGGAATAGTAAGGGISMGTIALGTLGAVALGGGVVAVASASGGGSDGGSSPSSSTSPKGPTIYKSIAEPLNDSTSFETAEYYASDGSAPVGEPKSALDAVHASELYRRSRYDLPAPREIVVAVMDTGVDYFHDDLKNQLVDGYSLYADQPEAIDARTNKGHKNGQDYDIDGHGTAVASIIAGERGNGGMQGIAYQAKIMSIDVVWDERDYDGDGKVDVASRSKPARPFHEAVNFILNDSRTLVVNGSFGTDAKVPTDMDTYEYLADQFKRITDSGRAFVFATGNDGLDNPAFGAALPYVTASRSILGDPKNLYTSSKSSKAHDYSSMKGLTVAVAASDNQGNIRIYSNRCGVAAAWCLVAPDQGVIADRVTTGTGTSETLTGTKAGGTSFSAPLVSGAITVLLQMFPNLTPEQAVKIILDTANKNITGYSPEIHGQGMLDVANAVSPQGEMTIKAANGQKSSLEGSRVAAGGAMGNAMSSALSTMRVASFDDYGRAFSVDLKGFAQEAKRRFNLDLAYQKFAKPGVENPKITLGAFNIQMNVTNSEVGDGPVKDKKPVMQDAEVEYIGQKGVKFALSYDRRAASQFGLRAEDSTADKTLIQQDAFTSPFASFTDQGVGSRLSLDHSKDVKSRFGVFIGDDDEDGVKATVGIAETWVDVSSSVSVNLQGGTMVERNSILGAQGEGAFAFEKGATTVFAGIGVAADLGNDIGIRADLHQGLTYGKGADSSLYNSISTVRSESFSAGLTAANIGTQGDSFSLTLHQPLRVANGSAKLHLEQGFNQDGTARSSEVKMPLKPTGREIGIEAGYSMPLVGEGVVSAGALLRLQPGHDAEADPEAAVMLKTKQPF